MTDLNAIVDGIKQGQIVPYLGAYALNGSTNAAGDPIPADSDSLIYAMNNGKPMAPKLMYEFPRAAMNLELKRGRRFITQFLVKTYKDTEWSNTALHDWLASLDLPYLIDINRDLLIQNAYKDRPHTLILGVARIGGTDYRFKLFDYDGENYKEITIGTTNPSKPILFKPMGSPVPEPHFIASDADYVDYITELMGGFAIPAFLKEYRQKKQYLLMGLRLQRDTERMVMADITFGADSPKGYILLPDANDKEKRFCERQNIEIIEADIPDLLQAAGVETMAQAA
ncbi:SIR2 family protein [Candidatus Albibeggiatoa sp. nov. NOAA]|uniref:SIR2 family protein n=1 Tax=Candidatus Albibeggiatoa sp. nov. NOAA TaxID=3162724 RepID=UPI0032F890ED|nr:SIR2 family protein [Thiotrichaceae bacterium]